MITGDEASASSAANQNVPSQIFAAHLLAQLAHLGARDIFLSPGARSQSLAIAAKQLADAGLANLTVRLDERSLAFQALGCAAATGRPSIVITTSGTAVANLHPAVLEAHHSGVGLILLTSDRPAELRGVGASQTANQVGLFADAVRECIDVPAPTLEAAVSGALAASATDLANKSFLLASAASVDDHGIARANPVQLNLAFREPLSALEPNASKVSTLQPGNPSQPGNPPQPAQAFPTAIDLTKNTVIVAGAGLNLAADSVEQAVAAFGLPIFAEPSSGLRHHANSIAHYRSLVASSKNLVEQIEQVIVLGKPTLSRAIMALIAKPTVQVFVVESRMGFFNLAHSAIQARGSLVPSKPVEHSALQNWFGIWAVASDALESMAQTELQELDRKAIVKELYAASLTNSDSIIFGASRMIREADAWAPKTKVESIWSNRGVAGIDGTMATALGFAAARKAEYVTATTRALIGDLTFLHDASSLAIDPIRDQLNLQLWVVNDHGGTIFESLEVAKLVDQDTFERIITTPQNVDLQKLTQSYGWQFERVTSVAELQRAAKIHGLLVIEILPS